MKHQFKWDVVLNFGSPLSRGRGLKQFWWLAYSVVSCRPSRGGVD